MSRLAEAQARIEELEREVKSLKDQLQINEVHHADDMHRVKARVQKSLKPEVSRLEDMLHANRCDPPKTHIVESYGSDILEKIVKLLNDLQH